MSTGGAAGDNILFSSTLNGTQSLGLTTGAGNITFTGAVGNTAALGDVTVTTAGTVLADSTFNAASYTQLAGSVSTTFDDLVTLSGAFDFIGQILNINGNGNNQVGTTMDVTNAGLFTTAVGANLTVGNDFVQNGAGLNVLGGNIASTTAGNSGISFATGVTLQNDIAMSTGGAAGDNILFSSTLNGAQDLVLTTGAGGDITFNGAVGGVTRLGAIQITAANDVTAIAITAASLEQITGQGTTTFNGIQNYNTAAGLDVETDTIALNQAVTTTSGGIVTLNADGFGLDAGTLTIAAAGDITSAGDVTLIGFEGITIGVAGDGPAIQVGTEEITANLVMGDNLMIGDINQVAGSVVSSGTTSINTAGNVLLFQDLNDFQGTVTVVQAGGISLYDSNVLSLASANTTGGQVFQASDRITTTGAGAFAAAGANGILMYSENSGVTINAGSSFSSALTQMVNANGAAFVNNGVSSSAFTGSVAQIFSTSRFLNSPNSFNGGLAGFAPNFLIVPTVQSVGETVGTAGSFNVTYTTTGGALPNRAFAFRTAFIDNLTAAEYFTITSTMANMTSIPVPNYQMYLPSTSAVSFRADVSPRPSGQVNMPGSVRLRIHEPSNVQSQDDTNSAIKSSTTSALIQAQEIQL